MCNVFTVRQNLCQVLVTQDIPQGGLGQKLRSSICITDISHGQSRILDPVVDQAINTHCHRVSGQNLREEQCLHNTV